MFSWRYFMLPCSEKSATVCPSPRRTHLVVKRPSNPTGPLACIRAVLMPTSAPAWKRQGAQWFVTAGLNNISGGGKNAESTSYLNQNGSRQQSGCCCSKRHKRCPLAAGNTRLYPHSLSRWRQCGHCHTCGCGRRHLACCPPPRCSIPGHRTLSSETSLQMGWKSGMMQTGGQRGF